MKKQTKNYDTFVFIHLSTDNVLEHIHARFSELAASTLAAANAAVTNEIEAKAIVKSEKKGRILMVMIDGCPTILLETAHFI